MRFAIYAGITSLAILVNGCGRKEPIVSHGKPVSHWVEALEHPEPKVRKKAVIALGHVGTADSSVLPALIEAVKDRDPAVRCEAILALFNIGPSAEDALPVLRTATKDTNARVRSYAAKALERIQAVE
jgi:HEAT repeat protein